MSENHDQYLNLQGESNNATKLEGSSFQPPKKLLEPKLADLTDDK